MLDKGKVAKNVGNKLFIFYLRCIFFSMGPVVSSPCSDLGDALGSV
jgi:hypothetical protein